MCYIITFCWIGYSAAYICLIRYIFLNNNVTLQTVTTVASLHYKLHETICYLNNLRGHNWFCPYAIIVYCYLEFKLRYLKNVKLFSVRVKELFEPVVLRKRQRVFALFKSIFLRNRSLSNARWFCGKKTQNLEGKSVD